jgi:hypothetical protein
MWLHLYFRYLSFLSNISTIFFSLCVERCIHRERIKLFNLKLVCMPVKETTNNTDYVFLLTRIQVRKK